MTPQEMLSAMEVGGGLAARAQQFDLQKQKFALDSAQVNLQMAHEQAKFPLQIQGLQMQNEANSRALVLQKKAMDIQSEDEQTMTNWQLENMDNPYAVLTNPPQVKTLGMLKQVAEMQAVIGRTAKGIQMTKQAIGTDPAVQALVEERRAQAEAAKARAEYWRRPTTSRGFAPTAGMKESKYADDLEQQASELEDQGQDVQAGELRKQAQLFRDKLAKTAGKAPLTLKDRITLEAHVASLAKQMQDMTEGSPEKKMVQKLLKDAEDQLSGKATPSISPKTETLPNPKDPLGLFK